MSLLPINVSKLQYLEAGQFIVRLLEDLKSASVNTREDPEIALLADQLKIRSDQYNQALKQILAQKETEEIELLDQSRDRKIAMLRRQIKVYQFSEIAEEKAAYNQARIIMKTHKRLERLNYEAETLGIDILIAEFSKPANANCLSMLHLQPHIATLKAAADVFNEKFGNRSTEKVFKITYDTKALKKVLLGLYKELATYVDVMALRKQTPYYTKLLTIINNTRHYYSDILAKRSGVADAHQIMKTPEA